MISKILFPIIASLVPLFIIYSLSKDENMSYGVCLLLSCIFSCALLLIIQFLLQVIERRFEHKNKYCGHWVEEMTLYQNNDNGDEYPVERMIGIGIIRFDRKTGEYVFDGNTYDLDGNKIYSWNIDYLHSSRDDSMQYVCGVQLPWESSIGQITFYDKNECDGIIWVMNGKRYKYNAHRITIQELYQYDAKPVFRAKYGLFRLFYRGLMMNHQDFSKFVQNYSKKRFPPLNNNSRIQ